MGRSWLVLGAIGLAAAGCGPAKSPHPASTAGRNACAELPRTKAAPHRELQAELALVEQERGLPLQVDPTARDAPADTDELTPARLLIRAFPPFSRALVLGQLDEIYRGGPLALSPVQLERGRELLRRQAQAAHDFRQALPATGRGFGVRLADGVLADLEFLDPLAIGCRLEGVGAAVALADNRPDDALPHFEVMLRAARLLAAEPNVTMRVAAANIRGDALHVLSAIATHDQASRETHEQLFAVLALQTADWPDDARAWHGDRAAGLLVYELVRDGQYLSLLSQAEMKALEEQRIVRVTAKAVMRKLDDDELFYLRAMRQMLAACQQPYAERQEVLRQIRGELAARESSADYPLVAGTILLADFEHGHRRQAEDFARSQAWLLALGTALGREPAAPPINPLTGQPYAVEVTPLSVVVSGVLDERDTTYVVPRVAAPTPDRVGRQP
ncbi:MAG: hypothetical protein SFU86_15975 [Pirellulaceae bacterium]|nr:hypothetical protein [Pirellulaceae bacterium]